MSIFRAYDIRGKYPKDLDEELIYKIGLSYANQIPRQRTVAVGMDVRRSSPSLKKQLIRGICDGGKNVLDLGLVPTPVVYFAIEQHKLKAGAIVTASHLPKIYNGVKFSGGHAIGLSGESGIYAIEKRILGNKIKKAAKRGSIQKKGIINEYIRLISSKIKLGRTLTVVIDAGNGCCGSVAPKLFRRLGCKVVELYCKPDGRFPNHIADPHEYHKYHSMAELKRVVKKENADIGIAYDGDGDRAGFVDNLGRVISEDHNIMLFARQALQLKGKGNIVLDIRSSNKVVDDIKYHGGNPVFVKAGHCFVEMMLQKKHALFGAELTGHLFFPYCYSLYDDGMFASLKMTEIVSETDSLATLVDSLPKSLASPEIRLPYPDDQKFRLIQLIKNVAKKKYHKIIDIDGVRVETEYGWFLIRASNTNPQITIRYEGKTIADNKKLVTTINSLLKAFTLKI